MTTAAAQNSTDVAQFWRVARRLYPIYTELDRTFELGASSCADLEQKEDPSDPAVLARIRNWFQLVDAQVHVWQLRQLLQSTSLQSEENLRYLILRHLEKERKSEADKEKIDFLLVQYFAHCSPEGVTEQNLTLPAVARVLKPVLGEEPAAYPDWAASLDAKLEKMNLCNSLEELQDSGGLVEAREMKMGSGAHYFEAALLVAFTRFNFLARRAFFRAMHLDLHAIRGAVNELEKMGIGSLDCRGAGLGENESLEQLRHVVHQWKTPFRAPYSGGASFQQLIQLRQSLNQKLQEARSAQVKPAAKPVVAAPAPVESTPVTAAPAAIAAAPAPVAATPVVVAMPPAPVPAAPEPIAVLPPPAAASPAAPVRVAPAAPQPAAPIVEEPQSTAPSRPAATPVDHAPGTVADEHVVQEDDYLQRCVADIAEQLAAMPAKHSPSVSAITLGGCKLMIATWEAEAFKGKDPASLVLQKAVAARTILHVCMDRHKRNEPTALEDAVEIAQRQAEEIKVQVQKAKEASNIDAAVNLAATAKRLLALVDEALKMCGAKVGA